MSSLTIDQLTEAVTETFELATLPGPPSARVREVPDKRTIRYYTTLGLLDRPAEMRGRIAYYGRRHLMQLVAIKRLQASGLSLVDIQKRLAGVSDAALARLADLPRGFWEQLVSRVCHADSANGSPGLESPAERARTQDFWQATPAEAPEPQTVSEIAVVGTTVPQMGVLLRLAEGVTLLLENVAPESLDAARLAKLQPHLMRLACELQSLGLMPRQS